MIPHVQLPLVTTSAMMYFLLLFLFCWNDIMRLYFSNKPERCPRLGSHAVYRNRVLRVLETSRDSKTRNKRSKFTSKPRRPDFCSLKSVQFSQNPPLRGGPARGNTIDTHRRYRVTTKNNNPRGFKIAAAYRQCQKNPTRPGDIVELALYT